MVVAVVGETPSPLESALETSRQTALFPLWLLPNRQRCSAARRVALPGCIPKALPPYNLTDAMRQRTRAQMKEQIKTLERELSDEQIANLSEGEFKALVINMLTELNELGQKMKE